MHSSNTLNDSGLSRLLSLRADQPAQSSRTRTAAADFGETLAEARRDLRQPVAKPQRQDTEAAPARPKPEPQATARPTGKQTAPSTTESSQPPVNNKRQESATRQASGRDAAESGQGATASPVDGQKETGEQNGEAVAETSAGLTSGLLEETVDPISLLDSADLDLKETNALDANQEYPLMDVPEVQVDQTPVMASDAESVSLAVESQSVDSPLTAPGVEPVATDEQSEVATAAEDWVPSSLATLAANLDTKVQGQGQATVESEPDPEFAKSSLLMFTANGKTAANPSMESSVKPELQSTEGETFQSLLVKNNLAKLAGDTPATGREGNSATANSHNPTSAIQTVAIRTPEPLLSVARNFMPQPMVAATLGQPQWSQAVGDRVLWLASQNLTAAELRLDPPDLGPMQVRISVQNDQVQVSFASPYANVREALDQSATRLREMFNEQGLNLNMDVSDQSLARHQSGEDAHSDSHSSDGELDDEEQLLAETPAHQVRLVDHYA